MGNDLETVSIENSQGSGQLHGPPPGKSTGRQTKQIKPDGISGICDYCPELTVEESNLFKELQELLQTSEESPEALEKLKSLLSQEDSLYRKILNVHNSSEAGGCETLLHLAADKSDHNSMKVLLEAGAKTDALNRWNQLPLHTVVDEGDGCHCPACNKKNSECVKLLLEHGSPVDVLDWEGDSPLACSALTLMDDCAKLLWQHGASIRIGGKKGERHSKAGELVASYIPDELCLWMDKAIIQEKTDQLKLQLDFGTIIGKGTSEFNDHNSLHKETTFLIYMTRAHRKAREKLLDHPLVQAYVYLKWDTVSILFTLLGLAYLGTAVVYTCFIISFFLYNCPYEEALEEEEAMATNVDATCSPTPWIYAMSAYLMCFVGCMVLNELYEMAQGLGKYFQNGLNFAWLLMIVSVILNILPVYVSISGHWQHVVAAFGIFFTWGLFLSQLARHPKIGIYVEMLGRIITEFALFSATYFALIIGFAFGFAVLFPTNPMFEYVYGFLPFVKVLLMMIGETDYETLFDENTRTDNLEYSILAHIIFVGFIIVVTILLSNLLLGLAISDVQDLRAKAKLSRTERLIQQIDLLETLFKKPWIPSTWKSWYRRTFSIHTKCGMDDGNKPEEQVADNDNKSTQMRPKGPLYVGFQPLKNDDKALPEDLREQFIRFVDTDTCTSTKKSNTLQPDST